VREEQVQVDKKAVVYEEVGIGKREVQDTQHVSGTVRREEARIEREGDVNVAGSGWDKAMPAYRQSWQQRYGTTGDRWEDAEPWYRYGHEMRSRPEYRGRQWSEALGQSQPRHPRNVGGRDTSLAPDTARVGSRALPMLA
jgi:hypothetical protein